MFPVLYKSYFVLGDDFTATITVITYPINSFYYWYWDVRDSDTNNK